MTETITIPRTLANKLLTLAQHAPDDEVCGLVARDDAHNYEIYSVKNIAENRGEVFEMEPHQQVNAFREMREKQQSLFAIFHSHPHADALPSVRDLDEASYTDALNIIISLNTTGVLDMRGYYYRDHEAQPVELEIE